MNNIVPTLRYIWLTTKHKWFVFQAGLRTKANIIDLVIHDFSKYGPSEAPHYGRQFFGDKSDPLGFAEAWAHHQNVNKHHWEYWIPRTGHDRGGHPGGTPLPMSERYVREMVADWLGASRAYEGKWPRTRSDWTWLVKNFDSLRLHPDTRDLANAILDEVLADD